LKISTKSQFKRKIVVLDLNGNTTVLPTDWVLIEYVILGSHPDSMFDYYGIFSGIIQSTMSLNVTGTASPVVFYWSDNGFSYTHLDWEVQFDSLVLPYSNLSETQVTVVYMAYETDQHGLPMVRETHQDAVRLYVEKALLQREQWRVLEKIQKGDLNAFRMMVNDKNNDYHRAVRQARADDSTLTEPDLAAMSYMYNNPYSGTNNYYLGRYDY